VQITCDPQAQVEPLALIVDALVAGAAAAAKDTTAAAIQDGYQGLKALIQCRFSGHPLATVVLEAHEADPHAYTLPLKQALADASLDQDEAILRVARNLLEQVRAGMPVAPVVHQRFTNVNNAAISGTGNASFTVQERGAGSDAGV